MNQFEKYIERGSDSLVGSFYQNNIFEKSQIDTMLFPGLDADFEIWSETTYKAPEKVFFTEKHHHIGMMESKPIESNPLGAWFVISMFLGFLFVLLVYVGTRGKFIGILRKNITPMRLRMDVAESERIPQWVMVLMTFNTMITFALLTVLLNSHFEFSVFKEFSSLTLFITVAFLFLGFQLIKNIIIGFTGISFKIPSSAEHYIKLNIASLIVAGVINLPFIFLAYFSGSSVFLFLAFTFQLLFVANKLLMLAITGFSEISYSMYYKFIYICTFEILPVLIFIKAVVF